MHFNFHHILLILALCGCLAPLGASGQEHAEAPEAVPALVSDFGAWAAALEARFRPGDAWALPFGAPLPRNLAPKERETLRTLRRLVTSGDLEGLASLVAVTARPDQDLPLPLRFWLAYGQHLLAQDEACLDNLEFMLRTDHGWEDLENGQTAWVLTGTADLLFLAGQRGTATTLYRRLADSPVSQLNLWGQYQLAGLDFLARSFEEASLRYGLVCATEQTEAWHEHACAMAALAGRMIGLVEKGEPHGAYAIVAP